MCMFANQLPAWSFFSSNAAQSCPNFHLCQLFADMDLDIEVLNVCQHQLLTLVKLQIMSHQACSTAGVYCCPAPFVRLYCQLDDT